MAHDHATAASRMAVRTRNVDEFHAVVAGLLRPFALTPSAGAYDARLHHRRVGRLGLTTIAYGNGVEIEADALARFYLVQVALSGAYRARSLGDEIEFAGDCAQIVNPVAPIAMRWNAECRQLVLRFDKALVSDYVAILTGGRTREAPIFDETLSLATPAGRRFRRTLEWLLANEALDDDGRIATPGARRLEQMLFAQFLAAAGHGLPGAVEHWPGAPYYVKRAEEFIADNLENDVGLADIVAAADVSMRTLYYGFRRCHGVGPVAWARRLRLDRAHADLAAADPAAVTVTEIATRWGFVHLGKFAQHYRTRFGASPSETLRGVR